MFRKMQIRVFAQSKININNFVRSSVVMEIRTYKITNSENNEAHAYYLFLKSAKNSHAN